MTDDEFEAESKRLTIEAEKAAAAWLKVKSAKHNVKRAAIRDRFDETQVALATFRSQWRQIGMSVPDGHPGNRPADGTLAIKVTEA